MSIDNIAFDGQLRGLSYEKAKLYGMPHLGCVYASGNIGATAWASGYGACACCGKPGKSGHSRHHEPPRSNGTFLLVTEWGRFVLYPALMNLCGSGTTGCHGLRHQNRLKIRWEWDSDEFERKWWRGEFLKAHPPHWAGLFDYGRYVFELDGKERELREGTFRAQMDELIGCGLSFQEAAWEMGIDWDG